MGGVETITQKRSSSGKWAGLLQEFKTRLFKMAVKGKRPAQAEPPHQAKTGGIGIRICFIGVLAQKGNGSGLSIHYITTRFRAST
ncbi:MAG: hypothetical protein ACK5UY_05705 [Holosporales bacterium]